MPDDEISITQEETISDPENDASSDFEILKEENAELNINCLDVVIAPGDVGVWEIENGSMKTYGEESANSTIQDKDGLIRQNYFNSVMGDVMRDFNNLLMYKD